MTTVDVFRQKLPSSGFVDQMSPILKKTRSTWGEKI